MFKLLLIFTILICAVAAGPVYPNSLFRCDSELIIIGCEGSTGNCCLIPGSPIQVQLVYTPSTLVPSLNLKIELEYMGTFFPLLDSILPNSPFQPGIEVTAKATIVPNDVLDGAKIRIRVSVYHTDNPSFGVCGRSEINFSCPP